MTSLYGAKDLVQKAQEEGWFKTGLWDGYGLPSKPESSRCVVVLPTIDDEPPRLSLDLAQFKYIDILWRLCCAKDGWICTRLSKGCVVHTESKAVQLPLLGQSAYLLDEFYCRVALESRVEELLRDSREEERIYHALWEGLQNTARYYGVARLEGVDLNCLLGALIEMNRSEQRFLDRLNGPPQDLTLVEKVTKILQSHPKG